VVPYWFGDKKEIVQQAQGVYKNINELERTAQTSIGVAGKRHTVFRQIDQQYGYMDRI
jgi:hypothetical protein